MGLHDIFEALSELFSMFQLFCHDQILLCDLPNLIFTLLVELHSLLCNLFLILRKTLTRHKLIQSHLQFDSIIFSSGILIYNSSLDLQKSIIESQNFLPEWLNNVDDFFSEICDVGKVFSVGSNWFHKWIDLSVGSRVIVWLLYRAS